MSQRDENRKGIIMDKGYYQINNFPDCVKEAWFYTGKESSIHIVMNPIITDVLTKYGIKKVEITPPQINIDLPSIRKMRTNHG